jgi:hypothetical protein
MWNAAIGFMVSLLLVDVRIVRFGGLGDDGRRSRHPWDLVPGVLTSFRPAARSGSAGILGVWSKLPPRPDT